MAEHDTIKSGEDYWRARAQNTKSSAIDTLANLGKFEESLARFRECKHEGETDRVGSFFIICYGCKWLVDYRTQEWEPLMGWETDR